MTIRLKDIKGLKGVDLQGRQKKGRFPVVEKSRRTMDGIVFDSGAEMRRYAVLKLRERAGEIADLELQPKYPVPIGGAHYCTFTPDFRYRDVASGRTIVEDKKTTGTQKDAAYRLRKKAAELHYGIQVLEVMAK